LGEKFIRQRREPSIAHKKNPARAGFLVQIRWARSLSASGGSPVLPTILTINVRIFFLAISSINVEASIAHNPDDECQDFFLAISSINMEASIAHNPDDKCQDFF
jgi:hypothetical protein